MYAFSGAETRKWLLRQDEDLTPPQPASSTDTGTYEHRLFTLGREGLVVRDASRGTPFHTLDLKVGDRIETLNGEDFSTAAGVLRSYASLREAAFSSKNACFRPSGTRQGRSLTPRILCLIND